MDLQSFFENFEVIAEAPGGVQKLRSLILDLAVRGKLVPQDPKDEPAEMLLKKLKSEKERLIQEKPRRRSENDNSASSPDLLTSLPNSWIWTTIGSFALIKGGKRLPPGATFSDIPTPHIYIQVTNMKDGSISSENLKYISEDVFEKISSYIIDKEDIYISIAGTIGQVGDVPAMFHGMNLTENAAKIVFRGIDKTYFMLALRSNYVQEQFKDKTNQQAQPKLALKRISDTAIPLPPLAEQKRIVAKVDELMALCDRYEAAKTNRDTLRQNLRKSAIDALMNADSDEALKNAWAIVQENWVELSQVPEDVEALRSIVIQLAMQGRISQQSSHDEAVEETLKKLSNEKNHLIKEKLIPKSKTNSRLESVEPPFTIPDSWRWMCLGSIAKYLEYGTSEKTSEFQDEVPVFRMNNIQNGNLIFENFKYVKSSIKDLPKLYLQDGDLLFNRTNSYELVGKTALFRGVNNHYTFASYLIRIVLFHNYVSPEFVNLALNSPYFRETQIEPEIVQQCGQANFNGTKLQSTLIPIPPLAEQKRIVAKVEQLMTLCDTLETHLRDTQEKAKALAAAAVSQLVV